MTAAFEPAGLRIGPVPSRDQVTIEMSVRVGSPEFFDVHDVTGRLVARIKSADTSTGTRAIWDGTDASGRRVGPGIYFVRVAGRSCGGKVVLLR